MISKLPPDHAHHSFLLDRFDNGDIYTGEFYAGSFLKGEFSCAHSGDTHTGDWKNGLKHGQGHTVYGSKDEYEGIYITWLYSVGSELSRGPFWDSRGPPSLLGIHMVPEIPAVPFSWQVNWRETKIKKNGYPNFIKDASRAISDP